MQDLTLDDFETLARSRRAARHFLSDPLPEGLLERLIEIVRWSPSGYNLQPTHFVLVTDPGMRERLVRPCMNQRQVREAPAVIVFTGDRRVVPHHFEDALATDRAAGAISAEYEALLRKVVPLAFGHGPMGLGWLWKATLIPLARLGVPIPSIPGVHKRYWLTKQVMLSAMTFLLAATAADLATLPMEGFDEPRVRRALGIPRSHIIPLIIAVGYAAPGQVIKTRLPLDRFVHRNGW